MENKKRLPCVLSLYSCYYNNYTIAMKKAIEKIVLEAIKKAGYKIDSVEVFYPEEDKFGDFSTNVALKLAKEAGKSLREVAEKITAEIKSVDIVRVEIAGPGFINIFVAPKFWQNQLSEIIKQDKNYGRQNIGKAKKVQVEFISANPTGPLTLGNGRGGYGGDALSNILEFLGYDVTREYYVNDGGNQIELLGKSVLKEGGYEIKEKEKYYYKSKCIENWTRKNKDYIKKNTESPKKIGKAASSHILEHCIKDATDKMGIKFDVWFKESLLYKKGEVEKALNLLKKKKLTYKKDSATWFRSSEFGDTEDRVIIKSDSKYTYIVPDIAYHYDKFAVRKFDKVINVLGTDHHGYVPRLQAAVSAMGHKGELEVILLQLVRLMKKGKEFKMSKRVGLFVTIDDLLQLIGGEDAPDVARFFFLSRAFETHMDFDLDLAKERSEKNPVFYVKYAHARLAGILEKAKRLSLREGDPLSGHCESGLSDAAISDSGQALQSKLPRSARDDKGISLLVQKEEIDLIKILGQLPEVAAEIASDPKYPVHKLTHYSIEIARKLHSFYDKCRVIDKDNPEMTAARLELVRAAKIVLKIVGEDLIGIKMPEKM